MNAMASIKSGRDYLGLDFVKKKSLKSFIFSLTRETDAQKKLNNFAKLQFLNDKVQKNHLAPGRLTKLLF